MRITLAFLLLFFVVEANAQYSGPAVDACRAYAQAEQKREGASGRVVFDSDRHLLIERYTRKIGNQFVSSILTGNGSVVFDGVAPAAELAFICLLASDKQPVFFNWLPRADYSAHEACTRNPATRNDPLTCLQVLERAAEDHLTRVYALRFQEANEKGGAELAAYRRSNEKWLEYRTAECAQHTNAHARLGCTIDLTRRRALDVTR
jgi:uncharacterized protein YecT (DUF1311 family)